MEIEFCCCQERTIPSSHFQSLFLWTHKFFNQIFWWVSRCWWRFEKFEVFLWKYLPWWKVRFKVRSKILWQSSYLPFFVCLVYLQKWKHYETKPNIIIEWVFVGPYQIRALAQFLHSVPLIQNHCRNCINLSLLT